MARLSIVFIHGFGGGPFEYAPLKAALRKRGYKRFYDFAYHENLGQCSLRTLARRFARFACTIQGPYAIIGMSQGGIIARLAPNKASAIITVCTPHKGTYLAYLSNRPGSKELRPGSKLLQSLPKPRASLYAIYTPLDWSVLPGWFARCDNAMNKRVWAPLHVLTYVWPTTMTFIVQSLMKTLRKTNR